VSEAKESADKKLGIDVVINFEGITKIVKTLQEKINIALKGQTYTDQTKAEFDVTEIRTKVANIEKKLLEFLSRKIPKGEFIRTEIATGGFGSTSAVEASLPSSMNIMGATTPQKLLNQYALENLKKIITKKEDERKDPFSNLELTSRYIGKFVNAWKGEIEKEEKDEKLRKAIENDTKTIFSEKEILYKEILRAILRIEERGERLTIIGILRTLQARQLKREGKILNPYAYSELGSTPKLKEFHKDITDVAKEAIKSIEAGGLNTKEMETVLNTAQEVINQKTDDAITKTSIRHHITTRTEAKHLAEGMNNSLDNLKQSLVMTDRKGQKETLKSFVKEMEENKTTLLSTSKEITDLQKDVTEIKTFADFMALKAGGETLDIMTKKLNEIISDERTQKEVKKKVIMAFQRAAELASPHAMKSVANYIKDGLERETKIKEVAEKFNKEYSPVFEKLSESMIGLKEDELKTIEKFSKISKIIARIGNKAEMSLKVIEFLAGLKIDEEKATIVEKTLKSYETHQNAIDSYVKGIKSGIYQMLFKAQDVQSSVQALQAQMDTEYFTVSDYANAIKNMRSETQVTAAQLDSAKVRSTNLMVELEGNMDELIKKSKEFSTELRGIMTDDELVEGVTKGLVEAINTNVINAMINRLNDELEGQGG